MEQYDLQQQLQQANELIKKAQSDVGKTQSLDEASLEQAHEQLQQAEFHLEDVQKKAGREATKHPQFQQAFQQLHNMRRQINEAWQDG
ncbi:MAG TPA: hypothetical protein VK119_07395 [Bacillota bacterium]|nr:hypothetical protein [Bacillota bacterium]